MKHFIIAFAGIFLIGAGVSAQTKTVTTYGKHEKPKDYVSLNSGTVSLGVGGAYNLGVNTTDNSYDAVPLMSGISAKYFFNEHWAVRGSLLFGRKFDKSIQTQDNTSANPGEEAAGTTEITNTKRTSNMMVYLGFEHRHKLSNRFFGYYGTDLAVGGSGHIERIKTNGELVSLTKTQRSFDMALLPFIGLEMFLGPKVSIASEFGYNLAFKFYSKDVAKNNETTEKTFPDTSISSNLDFGNSLSVALRLAYYF